MKDWPIFIPQDSARDLVDHPHRVQLVHDAAGLVFPALCPHCGAAASRKIDMHKVFRRTYNDAPATYTIESASVPFCDRCIALHEHEARTLSWLQRVAVSLASGVTISAIGSGFMAYLLLPDALRELARPGFPWLALIALFFALLAYGSLWTAWTQNAHRRVPPQTRVTRAFDFSESYAELFDAPRSTYSIRNRTFADAFIALNRERVWNPKAPAAKRAARSRKLVYAAALAALFAIFLWDLAGDLFGS
jgi:hypothetical protein